MSDKQQCTAHSMRLKMQERYGDIPHKHNKSHSSFRQHCRSHPVVNTHVFDEMNEENLSTGTIREFRMRKTRKRLDKGRIH